MTLGRYELTAARLIDPLAPPMILDPNIHLLGPRERLDYYDSQSVRLPVEISPLQAWNLITRQPQPLMRAAFWLRDKISARFGAKKIGGFSGVSKSTVSVGDQLDFFLVEHHAPDVLVLTVRDRHLDVMTCISICDRLLTITSSVVTHNAFGKVYMLPVGPAHRMIVAKTLRRIIRDVQQAG